MADQDRTEKPTPTEHRRKSVAKQGEIVPRSTACRQTLEKTEITRAAGPVRDQGTRCWARSPHRAPFSPERPSRQAIFAEECSTTWSPRMRDIDQTATRDLANGGLSHVSVDPHPAAARRGRPDRGALHGRGAARGRRPDRLPPLSAGSETRLQTPEPDLRRAQHLLGPQHAASRRSESDCRRSRASPSSSGRGLCAAQGSPGSSTLGTLQWASPPMAHVGHMILDRRGMSIAQHATFAYLLIAAIDYGWQRRRHERQLRMSKQESHRDERAVRTARRGQSRPAPPAHDGRAQSHDGRDPAGGCRGHQPHPLRGRARVYGGPELRRAGGGREGPGSDRRADQAHRGRTRRPDRS